MPFPGKIYFISEHTDPDLVHGGIGPVDIESILVRNNAIPLRFPFHYDFSLSAKTARFLHLVKLFFTIKSGSVVIFQHPLYARMNMLLLRMLRYRPSVRVICIIADIDGLKDGNTRLLDEEKLLFSRYSHFIVHNSNMEKWLKSFHAKAITSSLESFDFLTRYREHQRQKSATIVFAGNLAKSRFLENLDHWVENNPTLFVNLYGPGLTDDMLKSTKVVYKGIFNPYSLPAKIEGSFGLIWDGEGLEKPSGSLGDYMEFISHHKLSLYIVANLPVIVHETAGSAELVKKYHIGFTIQSLFEIENRINDLDATSYHRMVKNTHVLARMITSGQGVENALKRLLEKIETGKV